MKTGIKAPPAVVEEPTSVDLLGEHDGNDPKKRMAAQLKVAAARPENVAAENRMDEVVAAADKKEVEVATGLDLDFDPDTLIKWGRIEKSNIRVVKDIYVDMSSLTQKERILADIMIKGLFGNMPQDNVYTNAYEAALLALAITRINNKYFPIPDVIEDNKETKAYKDMVSAKMKLFRWLLDSNTNLIETLSVIFVNLERADALVEGMEGPTAKKSAAPSNQESSGSSVKS